MASAVATALRDAVAGRRRRRRPAAVPAGRHRHPAPGAHVVADARGRARPARRSPTAPRTRRSSTWRRRSAVCCWPCAPAADPTDALALVAALRTPLYGCSDVDLYDWKQAGGQLERLRRPAGGDARPSRRRRHRPRSRRSPTTSAGRRRRTCSTASSWNAASSRRRSPGPTPATCGAGCATSSTRPGRGPTPADGASAGTCAGPPTRPPRAGRATRSCPRAITTPCG